MTEELSLPPIFRQVRHDGDSDPVAAAVADAAAGAEPATLHWSSRPELFSVAVVLAPDRPLAATLPVLHVGMVAMGDCLGALVPPQVPLAFGWPDRIVINGATAGGVALHVDVAARGEANGGRVPDWLVLSVGLAMAPRPGDPEPGFVRQRTTLWDEGCGDLSARELIESFSRHFLLWMNRFLESGLRPVAEHWLERAERRGEAVEIRAGKRRWGGTVLGLDEAGGLLLGGAKPSLVPLVEVAHRPTWSID